MKRIRFRYGFTLIELLVVIAIIGILVSLILPAVNAARGAARNAQCKSQIKQVALASISYATANGDKVPGYGKFRMVRPEGVSNPGPHQIQCSPGHSWVVSLLPYIEEKSLSEDWDSTKPWNHEVNSSIGRRPIDIIVCPSDDTASVGGLSYVINTGYADMDTLSAYLSAFEGGGLPNELQMHTHHHLSFDWDQDGKRPGRQTDQNDANITRDTGISWVHLGSKNFSHRLDLMFDGTTKTILFGENINAGVSNNWSDPAVSNCAFVYPVDPELANGSNFDDPPRPEGISGLPNGDELPEGTPFLSSNHSGQVNVAMADGSVRSLADSIDRKVYKALLTPSGSKRRAKGFRAEGHISSEDY